MAVATARLADAARAAAAALEVGDIRRWLVASGYQMVPLQLRTTR